MYCVAKYGWRGRRGLQSLDEKSGFIYGKSASSLDTD